MSTCWSGLTTVSIAEKKIITQFMIPSTVNSVLYVFVSESSIYHNTRRICFIMFLKFTQIAAPKQMKEKK